MREGIRAGMILVFGLTSVIAAAAFSGCSWLNRESPNPSHQLRSGTTGISASGVDDRARQIESNLGVR